MAETDPFAWRKIVVARDGPEHRAKHLFAPCLHCHANGQFLIVCRWDAHGAEEGDATNEQALYFSQDGGANWTLAGDGPILTISLGTSFDRPSSITHAWILEGPAGRTWLYYTVNQPFTWGEKRPDRSTGGGEIRRQEIGWKDSDWRRTGASQIVWKFQQPLPDGRGGFCRDIRAISWNGVARFVGGTLLMPIGGRSTHAEPRGVFEKLNRVWVLVSRDEGATWPEAHFVGGGDHLCLAEPTLVTTANPDELVCLMRVQYQTGNQLHRAVSRDGGSTWSSSVPTGLPQADRQGVKPFLLRRRDGSYALIQTNEHEVIERTNLAVFFTDEAGLMADRWPQLRTVHIGNRRGWWPGACYGWLAEDANGDLIASWPSHDTDGGSLLFARLGAALLKAPVEAEPNGVRDELGDHVPRSVDGGGFDFGDIRGRLVAPDFGLLPETGLREVYFQLRVVCVPEGAPFRVMRFTTHNGRDEAGALLLDRSGWLWRVGGEDRSLELGPVTEAWTDFRCRIDHCTAQLLIGQEMAKVAMHGAPTGLQIGGAPAPAACRISIRHLACRALAGR